MPNTSNRTTASFTMPSFADDLLRSFSRITSLQAGPVSLGAAPSPTAPSTPARPSVIHGYDQSEADIRRGHAERRFLRAERIAGQQVALLISESTRLGLPLRPDCAERLARVAINAYCDYLEIARR